ncbi:unnamed protein product [Sphenostylis stenocarpa]|uniref:Uncharacterized protein n=1 Tax=Sphenostylis stenocarpa TaxID=92480 RepID=A0AA86TCQ4_9FABA|nr:unnamed protein product [Sphenostylis stenocarpa]
MQVYGLPCGSGFDHNIKVRQGNKFLSTGAKSDGDRHQRIHLNAMCRRNHRCRFVQAFVDYKLFFPQVHQREILALLAALKWPKNIELHCQSCVVVENGILKVTLSNPGGIVTGIQYNDIDNLLEVLNEESNRGYWDLVWSSPTSTGTSGTFDVIKGTSFQVMVENEDQVELSFTRTWDVSLEGKLVPLNIDKRFIMLRGCSGFYSYAIYEHLEEWPAFNLDETRIAFKLRKDK